MLKRWMAFIFIGLLFLLGGCARQAAQGTSVSSSSSSSTAMPSAPGLSETSSSELPPSASGLPKSVLPPLKPSAGGSDIADVAERIYSSKDGEDFEAFAGRTIFLRRSNEPYGYYSYSIDIGEMRKIGDTAFVLAGSASLVIMQNKFVYYTDLVSSEGKELLRLVKVDSEGRKITAIDTSVLNNKTDPLTYLSKLNENEFLLIGMANDKSYIKRYDCRTDTGVEIISETVTANKNAPNGYVGTVLSRMCVMDGEIYVIMLNLQEKGVEYQVGVYDREGKRLKTLSAKAVSDIFDFNKSGYSPLGMYGLGGYLVFENWNSKQAIYRIDGDMLTEIVPPGEGVRAITSGFCNCYSSKKNRYIFFQHDLFSVKGKDNVLFALEPSTGEIKQAKINLDKDYQRLSYGSIDEYGNLIIEVCKEIPGSPGSVDGSNYQLFYVKADDLPKVLN